VKAVARSGVAADDCLAIEDSERGLQAALGAGVPCLVVPTPLTRGCRFEGAVAVLDKITDVVGFLR
jgi:beta-phosphoglucomutase-like phosphatase (HAD superfamily)